MSSSIQTKRVYEYDGLAAYTEMPAGRLAETVPQVQRVLKICHGANVPVVARSAGTSLSAGATP